ncbi:MAG: hypothetical protein IPI60_06325 [Saprospiraceae bacterium]|nr:hypothetical protein [Saprospiraceae bacterium]
MNKYYLLIVSFAVLLFSCVKDDPKDPDELNYPREVSFMYLDSMVTYGVVLKEYTRDANNDTLLTPVKKLWLDRNLGAQRVATSENDLLAAGDLFQWGRGDDGHQRRNSDTTHTISATHIPAHNKFIAAPLNSNNWLSPPNNELWNGPQNLNCPCPEGWRVPTKEELEMEMNSWNPKHKVGAFASTLKWVPGGNRDNHGTERYTDISSFIWSSTIHDNEAYILAIISSDTTEIITSPRIFGGSVRCIKDPS